MKISRLLFLTLTGMLFVTSSMAEELLPGDFRSLDPESCVPDEWVIKGNKANAIIKRSEDGKSAIFLRNSWKEPDWLQIRYTLKLNPGWKQLMLKGTVKISGLAVGDQKWKTASVMPRFYNSDNKFIQNYQGVEWYKDGSYNDFSRVITIPPGAGSLAIECGFMGCNGNMDIEHLSLVPIGKIHAFSSAKFPDRHGELVPGNFAIMKEDTLPEGWTSKYNMTQIYSRRLKNGNMVLTLNNAGKNPDWRTISYTIDLDPSWKTLSLSGKVTISGMKPGKEKWNVPCIMPNYVNAKGEKIVNYDGVSWPRDGVYEFHREMKIPKGAAKLTLSVGFYGGNGLADFERISLRVAEHTSVTDFKSQEQVKPEVKQVSAAREEILLNGVWKFKPEFSGRTTGYGYIRVPGVWAATHNWMIPAFAPVPSPGVDAGWSIDELKKCYNATYEKTITVPDSWKDKRMLLSLDRVSSLGEVWVNERKAGEIKWPYGQLDIADAVIPGQPFKLRIRVQARPRNETIEDFTYYAPTKNSAEIYNRGLAGTVALTSLEKGPSIDGMFIKTSVRNKQMDVDVELDNKCYNGNAAFLFTIRDWKTSQVVKTAEFSRRIGASPEISVQNFKFNWQDPKLWDIDQPNLYTLEVAMKTPAGSDAATERFGFREVRLDGRHILLNEKPIRLRMYMEDMRLGGTSEILKQALKIRKDAGFNIMEICMNPRFEQYGSIGFRKEHADNCDEEGFLIMMPTVDFDKMAYRQSLSDKMAENWTKEFEVDWKRFRNNPSIILIVAGFNRFDTNIQRSPLYIGNRERLLSMTGDCKTLIDSGNKIIAAINKIDPTRPASSHSGSGVGNFHTSNLYLNFIPLQEREAWLSEYASKGDIPYCAVEFGTPLAYSFLKGREVAGNVVTTEPMVTEWCAIYLGGHAFAGENEKYRDAVAEIWRRPKYYETWRMTGDADFSANPIVCELVSLFVRNTWRSWRTVGCDGGMVPWAHAHGWNYPSSSVMHKLDIKRNSGTTPVIEEIQEKAYNLFAPKYANVTGITLVANNQQYLAYIAGKKSDYTTKDHHFFSSGKVEKQIAVINDSRMEVPYSFTCTVKIDGRDISLESQGNANQMSGVAGVGKTEMLPVNFTLPQVDKAQNGILLLKGKIAEMEFSDDFKFTVFPLGKNILSVSVYDRDGKTADYVSQLGFSVEKTEQIPLKNDKVLIVGENNMRRTDFPWSDLDAFVKNGGRCLLMTDKPEVFSDRFGFRQAPQVSRRAFSVPSLKNEILGQVPPDLIRDWNGAGLVVPKTFGLEGAEYQYKSHKYGFHWGNVGSVCSIPLEKPHASGWTPLFECEFALAYSPLLELRLGKGLVQLTTFDFVTRTERDPGAEKLFCQIVDNLAKTSVTPIRKTYLIGAVDRERDLLEKMTLEFSDASGVPDDPADLLIAGSEFNPDTPEFKKFLSSGGRAVILPRRPGNAVPGFTVIERKVGKNTEVPDWSVLRGVSLSDLYLKTDMETAVLKSAGLGAESGANGLLGRYVADKGEAVYIQMLPYMLDASKFDYRKFPSWRWTRLLSQILVNSGAVFKVDQEFLTVNMEKKFKSAIRLDNGWKAEFERRVPKVNDIAERLKDKGNNGIKRGWHLPEKNLPNWHDIRVGDAFQLQSNYFSGVNGVLWYRKEVIVPADWKARKVILHLGIVDDMDTTYFNGHQIGCTDDKIPGHWSVDRKYPVDPAFINFGGKNAIAVRCFDNWMDGGIMSQPRLLIDGDGAEAYHLYCDDYVDGIGGDDVYRYCNW